MRHFPLVALLFSFATLPSRADAPAVLPDLPALLVQSGRAPESFVVEGRMRHSPTIGVAFRIAADGDRQLCAVYDPSDGTPLMLSDGGQTLIYDLAHGRVVRIPVSRAFVTLDWDASNPRPLSFNFNVQVESNPKKLEARNSAVRIDRFVAASAATLRPLETTDRSRLFSAERVGGAVESVQVPAGAVDWFRFTSMDRNDDFYRLEIDARHIGKSVPAAALAFPELKALARDFPVHDLSDDLLPPLLAMIRDGSAWVAKFGLLGGKQDPKIAPPGVADGVTWDDLRKRDKELGTAYRAALAKQGVKFESSMTKPQ